MKQNTENTTCDFKESVERRQPKSWLKSVSAFANTIGGKLVFGVTDDGKNVGIDNVKSDSEFISDRIKTFIDPVPDFELTAKPTDNGRFVLEVDVKAGDMTPYYYVNSGTRTAFIRVGDESVAVSSHQLSALVLKGRNRTYDSLVTDDGFLTQAGVLFSDQCPYRHSSLYCTRWNGLEKDDALDSREYQGNLLTLLDAGVQFMTLYNKKGWIKLPNRRLDTPDYSDRALFEALVNALIHRDYSELGSEVHIDIYDNRLVIYSPGGMFDGSLIQNKNLDDVPSKRRNPILADVFTQFEFMEKRGSGLRKIRNETAKLPGYSYKRQPTFRSEHQSFFTVILNNNYDDDYYNVTQNVPQDIVINVAEELTERQQIIIKTIGNVAQNVAQNVAINNKINTQFLADKLGVNRKTIQRDLAELIDRNIIKWVGSNKTGHWEVNVPHNVP